MKALLQALLAAALLALALAAGAQPREAQPLADDPVVEQRLRDLAHELRCMVCQNESLADSRAPLAVLLRSVVREQLRAGASDQEVRDFLVARYGEFVLYRPPVTPRTWALWLGPFVLMGVALVVLVLVVRRSAADTPPPLSSGERRELDALLAAEAASKEQR